MNQKLNDVERMLNEGVEIETKAFGKIRIKEPNLGSVLGLAREFFLILRTFSDKKISFDDGYAVLMLLLADPDLEEALRKVASALTGKEPEAFVEVGVTDWLKLANAAKEVINWEELQELFFRLVPRDALRNLQEKRLAEVSANQ